MAAVAPDLRCSVTEVAEDNGKMMNMEVVAYPVSAIDPWAAGTVDPRYAD